jgi:hypothetical protein
MAARKACAALPGGVPPCVAAAFALRAPFFLKGGKLEGCPPHLWPTGCVVACAPPAVDSAAAREPLNHVRTGDVVVFWVPEWWFCALLPNGRPAPSRVKASRPRRASCRPTCTSTRRRARARDALQRCAQRGL